METSYRLRVFDPSGEWVKDGYSSYEDAADDWHKIDATGRIAVIEVVDARNEQLVPPCSS